MRNINILLLISLFALQCNSSFACTAVLVTKGASTDGSIFVAHSDDNELGDQRITYVAARDYDHEAKKPVFLFTTLYPRYVGSYRNPIYNMQGYPATKILGHIPQVKHTYGYYEGTYPIINEHQLAFAESTTLAKVSTEAEAGKRMFDIAELMRVAAERCKYAKDAVKLMGQLANEYGYYGDGEAIYVADKNEGWLFEICSPPDKTSALWAAKKIPDGEVAVTANEYRIRDIDPNDPNILFSPNLFDVAKKAGWWNPKDGKLDWLKTVSYGEYFHPYYSLRRVWRILTKLNPDLHLNPWVKDAYTKEYPFSVVPAKKLAIADVIALFRDHYEGTEFDLTKGIAAGNFHSPDRYYGKGDVHFGDLSQVKLPGAWERPISMFYTGFTTISQVRGEMPDDIGGLFWVGLDKPYTSVFMPFYIGARGMPASFEYVSPLKFDNKSAWWAFNFVSNWSREKFSYMKEDILPVQQKIEKDEFAVQPKIEKEALKLYAQDAQAAQQYLSQYCFNNANNITKKWWDLAWQLVAKYNSGYVNAKDAGYPEDWLNSVGYKFGPRTYSKPWLWWVRLNEAWYVLIHGM